MPVPFRSDLQAFLTEFITQHRGVRLGKMFGRPAGYVGRRLFTCLMEDGILIRLPEDVARSEIRKGGKPFSRTASAKTPAPRRGGVMGLWVIYRPRTVADARRLTPTLEVAARHVAERSTQF